MYYNQYRHNEPREEFEDINLRDENPGLETLSEMDELPVYEDNSVVEDGFRAVEDFEIEDDFVEFTPPYTCPFYRQPNPEGGFTPGGGYTPPRPPYTPPRPPYTPPRPPYGPHGGPSGNQGSVPSGPPPTFTPAKPQGQHPMHGGVSMYAVDPGAIRPCLYRYSYIWVKNGNSFWAYLTYVGRTSASGYRWNGRRWVYFGIDLRRIESFTCR